MAIATGTPGPDVLDIDRKNGKTGYPALRQAQQAGLIPPPGAAIRTPSGGAHLYFQGTGQRNGSIPAQAIDFRSAGGYVIAPPSASAENGRRYQVISHQPASAAVDWTAIRHLLEPQADRPVRTVSAAEGPDTIARLSRWLETRPPGNRNFPLFYAAKIAATQGLLDTATREQLIAASLRSGLRGGEREARRTLASGERAAEAGGGHRPFPPIAKRRPADMTTVTPIGARRRITALAWLGWSPPALAAVTGLPEHVFKFFPHQFACDCGQDVLDRIGAIYDLLWDTTPPTLSAAQRAQADATARHARRAGYAPPLAYDDDLIDTPDGGPEPGWKRSRSPARRDAAAVIEDIEFLRTVGYRQATPAELGDRLGRSKESIGRALARHRQAQRQATASQPSRSDDGWEASA